jgi:voltage-gated potassium channel
MAGQAQSTRHRALRHRVYEILEREDPNDRIAKIVFRIIVTVIVVNVSAAVLYTDARFARMFPNDLRIIESVSVVVFAVEYVVRMWSCVESPHYRGMTPLQARLRYSVTPGAIIDLIALLPFFAIHLWSTDMRSLAMLRLLRFFKLARYSPGLSSVVEALRAERHGLVACLVVLAGAILVSASAIYAAESVAQPDKFGSIPESMWWAVVTVTTVGYGDVVPVTTIGRVIGGITMVAGIFMLALPVGIFATAFIEVIRRRAFVVTWGMVARLPVFASLDAATLAEIVPRLRARSVDAGEIIVPRGEVPRAIFFIVSGIVEIDTGGRREQLGESQYFGEIHAARLTQVDARVRAVDAAQLLILTDDDIDDVAAMSEEVTDRLATVKTYAVT